MRESTIAKNYAEALFELGERSGETERFAELMAALADAVEEEPSIKVVLDSPRVTKDQKRDILADALAGVAPEPFIRFLGAVIRRGRQALLVPIHQQFTALVDAKLNRVRVAVTLARQPDEALRRLVGERLAAALSKTVVPTYRTDPAILGGAIVRVGDRIMDGSLRRRLVTLRRKMLGG